MLAARLGQLAAGFAVLQRLVVERPHLGERQQVGTLVLELRVREIGRSLLLGGAFARVLHGKSSGDDEHFGEAVLLFRGEHHASDARVEGKLREARADGSEAMLRVDRAELVEKLVAIGDHAWMRRVEQGELLDMAEVERRHAQDHGSERRAQDFGLAEFGPLREVFLVVETYAHTAHDAAAAARALVCGRARNLLREQLLDLVAIRVAVDAGVAGIDHVADARHGERSLGDVGGEHDAPRAAGVEHAILLLRR